MTKRKPKKPRAEWPFLVRLMLQRGTGIVGTSVARWTVTEGSIGRPFIRFSLETPDGLVYRVFVYPQQEKYGPKPEVLEEIMVEYEEYMKEKKEAAIKKRDERRSDSDAYKEVVKQREESRLK